MRDLVVVGGGGFGREVLDVVEAVNAASGDPVWRIIGVADDNLLEPHSSRLAARGVHHLGSTALVLASREPASFVVGVGNPQVRSAISAEYEANGWRPATVVHPASTIGSQTSVGAGSVLCSGSRVSTGVAIGAHVHVNPGAIVGHDSRLGDFVSVNPGAVISGEVNVERQCLIGAGAVVLQGLTVGEGATIGAASCVTRSVAPGVVVKGVPAR